MIVDRIQDVDNYDFNKDIVSNDKNEFLAFSNIPENNYDKEPTQNELIFPSRVTIDVLDDTTAVPNELHLKTISSSDILDGKKKKLIHIWGAWCPTTALGIKDIKKLIPVENDNYQIYLVSADMQTKGQTSLIERFLYKNQIFADSYIIENKFDSLDDLSKFAEFNHVIDFIKTFDPEYSQIAMPYTVVLDENNNILYKRALEIDKEDLQVKNETIKAEIFEKFKSMEVMKIKEILKK